MAADMANAMDEACECPEDVPEPCGTSVFTDDVIIGAAVDDELSGGGESITKRSKLLFAPLPVAK